MVFTPSPGTGDLIDVNPQFVDTLNWNFSLKPTSPCIASGKDGYDRGAVWYTNRPRAVDQLVYTIADTSDLVDLSFNMPTMMLDSTLITQPMSVSIFRNDTNWSMLYWSADTMWTTRKALIKC